jgi:N-acetylneuraminate synthase
MTKNTFIIAEIGQAHEGSLGILHSYIDAIATTGVDAIKFQTHIAAAESSQYEPFRIKFSYEDDTRYDYWERMGFTFEQWGGIKEHCDRVGLEFISSPFSQTAVDWLEKLQVKRYKIGSGEVNNLLMLQKIALTQKQILLSSGMSSFEELDASVDFLKKLGSEMVFFQCTTSYPTPPERIGLNVITDLIKRYDLPVGLSDHSGSIYPSVAAVAMGASYLEFHATFDRRMFGPDTTSSLTINEIKQLVDGVRLVETSLNNPIDKTNNSAFEGLKKIFEKSLALNKDLPAGHILTFEDLETKKPSGYGISAKDFETIIGKTLKTTKKQYDFLTENDI